VYKRDGRLVPFEADKISRALFAAGEQLGRPDAFLARELTDGILYFLDAEAEETILSTAQVADLVVKVVRELGQPAIAQAFAEGARHKLRAPPPAPLPPLAGVAAITPAELAGAPNSRALSRRAGAAALRAFSLREVFARDLVAAHQEGLLTLTGLETPLELSGWVLGPPARAPLVETLEAARSVGGEVLAIDGPEYVLAGGLVGRDAAAHVRELTAGVRAAGVRAVVNLNCATPPPWAGELAAGPLFEVGRPPASAAPADLVDELFELFLNGSAREPIQVHWHLGERDFLPERRGQLHHVIRRALEGAPVAFTFDWPRRPAALAEGTDRRNPAVLMTVGLHLPRFAAQLTGADGTACDAGRFLRKLGSLARMALSAGVQKRAFLRRHGREWPPFLLDRARLVVAPVGLEWLARQLTGVGLAAGGPGLEIAVQVLVGLEAVLIREGSACRLECCLAAPHGPLPDPFIIRPLPSLEAANEPAAASVLPAEQVAGVTPWDGAAPLPQQLKAAAALNATRSCGTAALLVNEESPPTAEALIELLYHAWRHTEIPRLRLVCRGSGAQQLTAPWEGPDA
jgi:hypothetical protein